MQWLRSLVRRSPKAAMVIGKTLFLAGAILILGAFFARFGLMAAYPQLPAWLAPQGPVGYSIAAALVLAGMVLTVFASENGRR